MKKKLKKPLKIDNDSIIKTVQEEKVFFLNREKETNKILRERNAIHKESFGSSSGSEMNYYGLDLI